MDSGGAVTVSMHHTGPKLLSPERIRAYAVSRTPDGVRKEIPRIHHDL